MLAGTVKLTAEDDSLAWLIDSGRAYTSGSSNGLGAPALASSQSIRTGGGFAPQIRLIWLAWKKFTNGTVSP